MRTSISLHSNKTQEMGLTIDKCMRLFDYTLPFQVSRTVGHANYFEIEKRFIEDDEISQTHPKLDIHRRECREVKDLLRLYRDESSLQAHFTYCRSEFLGRICKEIASGFTEGFFYSDAFFTFGPTDIIRLTESADGERGVELVSLATVQFVISSDNFLGDPSSLGQHLEKCDEFQSFQTRMGDIVGDTLERTILF